MTARVMLLAKRRSTIPGEATEGRIRTTDGSSLPAACYRISPYTPLLALAVALAIGEGVLGG